MNPHGYDPGPLILVDVPPDFAEYCQANGAEPREVLQALMADLAPTVESGTSVDRGRAAMWFHGIPWGQPRFPVDDEC